MKTIEKKEKEIKIDKMVILRKTTDLKKETIDWEVNFPATEYKKIKYLIEYEVELTEQEWKEFINYTLREFDWIKESIGGFDGDKYKMIKVKKENSDKYFLVNPEGYNYPRYIGIVKQ